MGQITISYFINNPFESPDSYLVQKDVRKDMAYSMWNPNNLINVFMGKMYFVFFLNSIPVFNSLSHQKISETNSSAFMITESKPVIDVFV